MMFTNINLTTFVYILLIGINGHVCGLNSSDRKSLVNSIKLNQIFKTKLMDLEFVGIGNYKTIYVDSKDKNKETVINTRCFFLTIPENLQRPKTAKESKFYAMPVPISDVNLEPLISAAYSKEGMSKVKCLALNSKLYNRDGGLFDNLPWEDWSLGYSKDAAGNVVDGKYRFGKRDAFNRMNGKDWPGRSLSIGNLAARVMYELNLDDYDNEDNMKSEKFDDRAIQSLTLRVLEVELREARSLLAEVESELALSKQANEINEVLISRYNDRKQNVEDIEETINTLTFSNKDKPSKVKKGRSFLKNLLQSMIDMTYADESNNDTKKPPYRGAYGYAPYVDSRKDMFEKSVLPYSGTFDLLSEIIEEQLRADVIGVVIEDSWLLDGLILGGTCVLERQGTFESKSMKVEGENLEIKIEAEDNNADIIETGDIHIAECESEEAIGLAIQLNYPISVEKEIWEQTKVRVVYESNVIEDGKTLPEIDVIDTVSSIKTIDNSMKTIDEEQDKLSINVKSTSSLLGGEYIGQDSISTGLRKSIEMPSLEVFDSLSLQDKAKMLLSLSSSKGRLPRPRKIREEQRGETANFKRKPLDSILLPYVDESIRRQYLRREAILNGDIERAKELQEGRSKRQQALELAAAARRDGNKALSEMWLEEAELYGNLRADVTQDEGDYGSFLDKDEWYERDRLARAKKLDKKKFGNLFDGL